jgi:hypothetical protein
MTTVEQTSEALARRISRRSLLNRWSAALFGVVAAWSVEGLRAPGALAVSCAAMSSQARCNLPGPNGGQSCGKFCSGSLCKGACKFDTSYYATGCWCTQTSNGGYYECCDCNCNGRSRACGCARFVAVA